MPGFSPACPACAHHVVEGDAPFGLAAQFQIECERDQRALGIVADDRIPGIGVLLVELRPGIEARLGNALPEPPATAQHTGDCPAQQFEIALFGDEAAADQRQVIVIRRNALEYPQQLRMALRREFVWREHLRLHALDVPGMEVLVTGEAEEGPIRLADSVIAAPRQSIARADEARGPAMLETAVAAPGRVQQEQVSIEIGRGAQR